MVAKATIWSLNMYDCRMKSRNLSQAKALSLLSLTRSLCKRGMMALTCKTSSRKNRKKQKAMM